MGDANGRSEASVPPVVRWIFILTALTVVLVGLRLSSSIVAPLALATAIVLGVTPFEAWLVRRGLRPGLAYVVTVLLVLAFLGALVLILWVSLKNVGSTTPKYATQLTTLWNRLLVVAAKFGVTPGSIKADPSKLASAAQALLTWVGEALSAGVLALTFVAFMLLGALDFRARFEAVVPAQASQRISAFAKDIQRFISIMTLVNVLMGVADTVILLIMGIPFAALWGVLAFLLGYIPTIGFMIALVPPTLLALLIGGPMEALIVIVAYTLVSVVVSNVVLPRLMSEGLDMSPFVVVFSLVFWSFILGPLGAILAIPLTMTLRLALESSPDTAVVAGLMGRGKTQGSAKAPRAAPSDS